MTISIQMIAAFVTGVIIPCIVALFGREALGKMLLGKQRREDTALTAILDLAKESVAGWREATATNMTLTALMERVNLILENHDKSFDLAIAEFNRVKVETANTNAESFNGLNSKMDTLIRILAEE